MIFRYAIEEGPKVFEREIHGKHFTMYDDTVIAFGAKNEELFRTKVEEPFLVRPNKHLNSI
jgi:nitrate reductase beta subunit